MAVDDIVRDKGGAVFNVLASGYNVTGDGTTNDFLAIRDIIYAAGGILDTAGGGILFFPPVSASYLIESDLEIPATVTIAIAQGAKLKLENPNGSPVLTVNGRLDAGAYQIFDVNANATPLLFGDGVGPEVLPEWFGAQAGNLYGPDQGGDWDMNPESITDSTEAFKALWQLYPGPVAPSG